MSLDARNWWQIVGGDGECGIKVQEPLLRRHRSAGHCVRWTLRGGVLPLNVLALPRSPCVVLLGATHCNCWCQERS